MPKSITKLCIPQIMQARHLRRRKKIYHQKCQHRNSRKRTSLKTLTVRKTMLLSSVILMFLYTYLKINYSVVTIFRDIERLRL